MVGVVRCRDHGEELQKIARILHNKMINQTILSGSSMQSCMPDQIGLKGGGLPSMHEDSLVQ